MILTERNSQTPDIYSGINQVIYKLASIPPVRRALTDLATMYASKDTIPGKSAGLHSGLTASALKNMETGMDPLNALKQSVEDRDGTLSSKEEFALYSRAATNGVVELVGRGIDALPVVGNLLEKPYQRMSVALYKKVYSW